MCHQISRLRRLVDQIGEQAMVADDVTELPRLRYGLYAVRRLRDAQAEGGRLQPG